jgi:tryptophan-rich sensory protein
MKRILKLVFCVVTCQGVGFAGSFFTLSAIPSWYARLVKPPLNPPNWIFGPVWIILYLLMAVAVFLVWEKGRGKKEIRIALELFALQLFLNAVWTPVFFGVKDPMAGLLVIILLWITLFETLIKFFQTSAAAGALLVPYILWISFAVYLNAGIYWLNR